jgi:hypothetical protein
MWVPFKQVIVLGNSFPIISIPSYEHLILLWFHLSIVISSHLSHLSANKEQNTGPDDVQWFLKYLLLYLIQLPLWMLRKCHHGQSGTLHDDCWHDLTSGTGKLKSTGNTDELATVWTESEKSTHVKIQHKYDFL